MNSVQQDLVAFIASDMPQYMKDSLSQGLNASLEAAGHEGLWTPVEDTKTLQSFDCLHFTVYARNLTQVRSSVGAQLKLTKDLGSQRPLTHPSPASEGGRQVKNQ